MHDNNRFIRRAATLTFLRSQLIYDISNLGYIEGYVMELPDSNHSKHQTIDITEDGNLDRVVRVLNLAYAECVELLHPFASSQVVEGTSITNELTDPTEYIISLELPNTVSQNTVHLLEKMIHEYMVCRVMHDWLSITYPEAKSKWEEKIENVKSKIKSTILWRTRKLRIKQSPF